MSGLWERLFASARYRRARGAVRARSSGLVDPDDMEGEFHLGMAEAARELRRVGDPMEYLIQRGHWKAGHYQEGEMARRFMQVCQGCGQVRVWRGRRPCSGCLMTDFGVLERQLPLDECVTLPCVDKSCEGVEEILTETNVRRTPKMEGGKSRAEEEVERWARKLLESDVGRIA